MAKLEKPEAVSDLSAIVDAFDGLMVARGDLGVEMPLEQVPLVQKRAIGLCRQAAKPVIVATQMLDSMITDRRPTRAEVSDVANAVFDGTDAVMLSAESSVGAYPAHTVATMARIVEAAEDMPRQGAAPEWVAEEDGDDVGVGDAVAAAACELGQRLGAMALCCFTRTGDTALRLARQRSPLPLLAFAHDESVRARLAFSWGIESAVLAPATTAETLPTEVGRGLAAAWACGIPGVSSWWCPGAAAACPDAPTRCACSASNDGAGWSARTDPSFEVGELGAQRPLGFAALAHLAHDRRYPDDPVGLVPQ
jgi:pyruvate kinase